MSVNPHSVRPWVLAFLMLVGAGELLAADLEAGWEAFRRGDYATALREWTPLAEAGDARAQSSLAWLYANGWGVEQDHERAAELYREAAEAGVAEAQLELGRMHLIGRGVAQDAALAVHWYQRAARRGLVEAQYRLGTLYETGVGTRRDPIRAATWYRRAAEGGHAESQFRLGMLLSQTPETSATDYAEAARWLAMAADRGDGSAAWRLGWIYSRGWTGKPDYVKAIPLLREAVRRGVGEAAFELGLIYENGAGVRDPLAAREWYRLASKLGQLDHGRLSYDPRLRTQHLRTARIFDDPGTRPLRIRTPEEIRRGPAAQVRFAPSDEVYCEFNHAKTNRGGNPKFRCFLMTGSVAEGGRYYDEDGNVRPEADAVRIVETANGPRPVLAARRGVAGFEPLTTRDGFRRRYVFPLELKIKYRSLDRVRPIFERDMYSEVAAARLLWALHYPADCMFRVRRIHCHRCPRDPFQDNRPLPEGRYTTFDDAAIELRYGAGRAENYHDWQDGGWSWGEELHRLRYGTPPDGFDTDRKRHFDGLIVLMNLIWHVSIPPHQNRLICLRGTIQQLGGPFKHCPETVLLVHDLGATFGKRHPDSLRRWRNAPVWEDVETCEAALPLPTHDEFKVRRYRIGKAGQEFILGLLDQLTDEHLRALFETAGFERFDITLVRSGDTPTPERARAVIDSWIEGFKEKIEQVRAADCLGP
jgi:TPR repeat protein